MVFASKMISILLFFVLYFCLCSEPANAKTVKFQKCPGKAKSDVNSVDISPCDADRCVFHKGTNVTFTLKFVPKETVTASPNTIIEFFAEAGPIKRRIPLDNPMACEKHGLTCPLKPGVEATLVSTSLVKQSFPSGIPFTGRFDMKDQNKEMVFCVLTKDIVEFGEEIEDYKEEEKLDKLIDTHI